MTSAIWTTRCVTFDTKGTPKEVQRIANIGGRLGEFQVVWRARDGEPEGEVRQAIATARDRLGILKS
jgi:hypothetical protein